LEKLLKDVAVQLLLAAVDLNLNLLIRLVNVLQRRIH